MTVRSRLTPLAMGLALAACAGSPPMAGDSTVQTALPENSAPPASNDFVIGRTMAFDSEILDGERQIQIALPEGYDQTDWTYPVLYVIDGSQNFRHVVGAAEVLGRTGKTPPLIVVGIDCPDRLQDLSPSETEGNPESGGGGKFLGFLQKELIPYIEANYRAHSYRILEGHSLGGLFAVYALMESPDAFDAYVVMAPSLWWNGEEMTSKVGDFLASRPDIDKSVFLSIGERDGVGMRDELKRFVEAIERAAPKSLDWHYEEIPDESHMSAPLLINYRGLIRIFSDLAMPAELHQDFDASTFAAHAAGVKQKYGAGARDMALNYVIVGFDLVEAEKYSDAILVFERLVEAYPNFHAYYAWLADAHEKTGDLQKALERYQDADQTLAEFGGGDNQHYDEQIDRLASLLGGE